MGFIGWRFPPLSGGTRQGYTNNDIEVFKGEELMDNLAREICQNSLDAKDKTVNSPVKVVFELKYVKSDEHAVFSGYKKCIEGCKRYWGANMDAKLARFLSDATKMLNREEIPVLIAGDYNTRGLCGSRTRELKSTWEALTDVDGMSFKQEDTSAGAYGIGKNAPFACSALSMVFYGTAAEDGEKAFVGIARLATLYNDQNKETQRVGKYQNNNDAEEKWMPIFEENEDSFRDIFKRDQRGTDVIVVGFNQENHWTESVEKAIIKNFFVAIKENKLVVEIKNGSQTITINSGTLEKEINAFSEEMVTTYQLYKAFVSPDNHTTLSILEKNDVEVYIKSENDYSRTIANFRNTGMLVGQKSRRIFQHYAADVIVRGEELDALLKDTEPPRHNRWDYKLINGAEEKEKRKRAKIAIYKIDTEVLDLLKKQFEEYTEDTVDAIGVGEYLPDDVGSFGTSAVGDDILKAKIKIGKVKTVKAKKNKIDVKGTRQEGTPMPGDVKNLGKSPNPVVVPKVPQAVTPGEQQRQGAAYGNGSKRITIPNIHAQRAFPIDTAEGIYKIVLKPAEDCNNVYIACSAMGEDGKNDIIEIKNFTQNGKNIDVSEGKAGPIKLEKNIPSVFFAKFDREEKMVLNLHIAEVNEE